MDWNSSGIAHEFTFEAIPANDLGSSLGFIDGVTGFSIVEDYRSDYRASMSLLCDGADIPANALIRIHHRATLDGSEFNEVLGTFMQDVASLTLIRGRYTGNIDFYSPMIALGTDIRPNDRGIAAGTKAAAHFESIVSNSFQRPLLSGVSTSAVFPQFHIWEAGASVLSECHACADAVGGIVNVEPFGGIVLERYTAPVKRANTFDIKAGAESVTITGLQLTDPERYNKAIAFYDYSQGDTTTRLSASASVPEWHPWHPSKIGRWITVDVSSDVIDFEEGATVDQVKTALQSQVDDSIAAIAEVRRSLFCSMLYQPIRAGEVGRFNYIDGGQEISTRAILATREINWSNGSLTMNCTFEEVGNG